jgi:hypothetical protein
MFLAPCAIGGFFILLFAVGLSDRRLSATRRRPVRRARQRARPRRHPLGPPAPQDLASEGRTVFVSSHLMSEMEDTADHLVVIGRGGLVADAPIGQVVAGSSHTVVRVRTPAAAQLGRLLAPTAQTVRQESDSLLTVVGLTTDDVGEVAHATGIRLHELTLRSASLEQAYLELSQHQLDYGTSQLSRPGHGHPTGRRRRGHLPRRIGRDRTGHLAGSTILGIGTGGILAVSARSAAALTLTSMLVVGLGAVLRSAAGTITTAVAVLFAPPILGVLVSNQIVVTVIDYLPAGLSTVLVGGTGERYGPEVAALLLGAWAVAALAVGVITVHRRDP